MIKINVLDSSVYNLISAGEVVERPLSVVKELVENSIDACAKNIHIDIVDGGKTRIKVSDDGVGIDKAYIETAFLPHATSKISKANDLESISTLGFRGEALASIASVTMITLQSKTVDDDSASVVELNAGKIQHKYETSGNVGTAITVDNLFFNTPARIKFLKKNKTEELAITSLVTNLILSNPNISFTYTADSKIIYKTSGNGLKNTLFSIYSREITMNLVEIENTFADFTVDGFISKPTFTKGSRSFQTIILNGRVIENKTISTAVEKAYESFLMKHAFPLYVLNIKMPYDFLDINVHPSKIDVRFLDNNKVFSFIYHSISNVLMNLNEIKGFSQFDNPQNNCSKIEYIDEVCAETGEIISKPKYNNLNDNDINKTSDYTSENANSNFDNNLTNKNSEYIYNLNDNTKLLDEKNGLNDLKNLYNLDILKKENVFNVFPSTNKLNSLKSDSGIAYRAIKAQQSRDNFNQNSDSFIDNTPEIIDFNGKIVGQLFETYIIIEKQNVAYFIDQHAAHERILYDELSKVQNNYAQPLLLPYIYEANYSEYSFLLDICDDINKIGFDIEPFGNLSFKISAVPSALTNINFDTFFAYILSDLSHSPILKAKDLINDKLKQIACKSAVKAGDCLNYQQIEMLLKVFNESECLPLQCPHGRPAVIKISKTDLEKWFKRIV